MTKFRTVFKGMGSSFSGGLEKTLPGEISSILNKISDNILGKSNCGCIAPMKQVCWKLDLAVVCSKASCLKKNYTNYSPLPKRTSINPTPKRQRRGPKRAT